MPAKDPSCQEGAPSFEKRDVKTSIEITKPQACIKEK
jgi:hypothetical protein